MARTVQEIEKAIAQLPKNQLRQFRAWYKNFDSDAWDEQIENDIAGGKLDGLADAAITAHKTGKSNKI